MQILCKILTDECFYIMMVEKWSQFIEGFMNKPRKTPAYNLKVVIRETGLKADTLRAWERRYGLPNPQRTAGGHRLYSQYDIEMIKWLIERQNEGLRINRAVQLWQSFEEQGKDPLEMMPSPVTMTPADKPANNKAISTRANAIASARRVTPNGTPIEI